jgi:hypothetical protein
MENNRAMEDVPQDFNEWILEPQAEYRFELEQGSSIAIKVEPVLKLRNLSKPNSLASS